jgi:hypothetical protein
MMNEELKLCAERQGEQHYKHIPHFHENANSYQKQLDRDNYKREALKKNGYILIDIPYTIHYDILEEYIRYKLSQYPEYKKFLK